MDSFSHEGDKMGKNATAKKDTESTALYLEGETPESKDIVDGPKDEAKTEANAKASLKRFMTPLTVIVRCQILSKQNMLKFRCYKGDKCGLSTLMFTKKRKVHHQALKII